MCVYDQHCRAIGIIVNHDHFDEQPADETGHGYHRLVIKTMVRVFLAFLANLRKVSILF